MVMLLIVNAALPELLSVITLAGLLDPTGWLLNTRLPGERLAAGAMPVPVRETTCGLPVALSVTLILAVRVPVAAGVKTVLMEHEALIASEVPQVLVSE